MDLNADVGESYGAYSIGQDAALIPLLTSANIACGFHGGDPEVMETTVRLALAHGVALGAHPGFPDLMGFGRRLLAATPSEIEHFVLYQIGALDAFARANGARLAHVKPHGALYNLAAQELEPARAIGRAIARFDPALVYMGQAGSAMIEAARELGLRFAREGFVDRAYEATGALRSRRLPGAVYDDPARAAAQAVQIACEHTLTAFTGEVLPLEADTLCLHGDNPHAVEIAREVRLRLSSRIPLERGTF